MTGLFALEMSSCRPSRHQRRASQSVFALPENLSGFEAEADHEKKVKVELAVADQPPTPTKAAESSRSASSATLLGLELKGVVCNK